MTQTVSTRLPEDVVEELERIAEEEHLDRSALIRKMLVEDVETYRKEEALERYRRGEIGIEQAARQAEVPLWEFVDVTIRENVQPPPEETEQLERELEEAEDVLT
jgi:predicted transcriptional regulator